MSNKLGLTGILTPIGEFIECSYGNHCEIAVSIPQEEEMKCIYFSSNLSDVNSSLLFFNEDITNEQLRWLIFNHKKLDKKQRLEWKKYIKSKIERGSNIANY